MPNNQPPTSPISTNLLCYDCKYNLRALPPTQTCPECGSPIQCTLDNLSHAKHWPNITTLAINLLLITTTIFLIILFPFTLALISLLILPSLPALFIHQTLLFLGGITLTLSFIPFLIANFLYTNNNPAFSPFPNNKHNLTRHLIRILLTFIAIYIITNLAYLFFYTPTRSKFRFDIIFAACINAFPLLAFTFVALFFRYTTHITQSLNCHRLTQQIKYIPLLLLPFILMNIYTFTHYYISLFNKRLQHPLKNFDQIHYPTTLIISTLILITTLYTLTQLRKQIKTHLKSQYKSLINE
ncbi:hypothetical protein JD969_15460 [Planctomycetota bacterium]|nr:hypothetical protein JD969_15460 [Planctomycetota bacterium]